MKFLKNLFSINEMKASALILSLFIAMGMILFSWLHTGTIPDVLINLTESIAYSVGAINTVHGASKIVNSINGRKNQENQDNEPKG